MSISPDFCCCSFVMLSFPSCQMLTFVSMLPWIHCILSPFWCSHFLTKVHVHQISTRPECLCSYLAKQTKLGAFSNSETWCVKVAVKLWSSPENRIQVLLKTVVMFRIHWAAVSLKGPHPGWWMKWRVEIIITSINLHQPSFQLRGVNEVLAQNSNLVKASLSNLFSRYKCASFDGAAALGRAGDMACNDSNAVIEPNLTMYKILFNSKYFLFHYFFHRSCHPGWLPVIASVELIEIPSLLSIPEWWDLPLGTTGMLLLNLLVGWNFAI